MSRHKKNHHFCDQKDPQHVRICFQCEEVEEDKYEMDEWEEEYEFEVQVRGHHTGAIRANDPGMLDAKDDDLDDLDQDVCCRT